MTQALPARVAAAEARADSLGFTLSCDHAVGRVLAVLAAAVPPGGRVLELGTGAGVGLAWLAHGVEGRADVSLTSVELDAAILAHTQAGDWPGQVRFEQGDGADRLARLGDFDLIFADAPGGKLSGLDTTIGALRPGGVLVVDDMDLAQHADAELRSALTGVRDALLGHPELRAAELAVGSGMILATRLHRSAVGAV